MAEGYARSLAPPDWKIASAGIEAHGQNPRAVAVMAEDGVDISQQQSSRLQPEQLEWADLVVTVCGHADEHCPAVPAGTQRLHWPLEDPARARGGEQQILAEFRRIRDDIHARVRELVRGSRRQH
jgi:arsenate reductase